MKIKKSITDKVKAALNNYSQTLMWAIIELCKEIDCNESGKIYFRSPFVLSSAKMGKKNGKFSVEYTYVDSIIYGPTDRMSSSFILCYDENGVASSFFLSIGDLQIVYDELKKTALHE